MNFLAIAALIGSLYGQGYYFARSDAGGGGAPSLILDEQFDGTGAPSGWSAINTVDWDYTTSPAPLEGTQSVYIDGQSGGARAQHDFGSDYDTVSVQFIFRCSGAATTGTVRLFSFRNQTGDSELAWLNMVNGAILVQHGTQSQTTVGVMSLDTTYYVRATYTKSTSSNGILKVGFSTTTTIPTSGDDYQEVTNGSATSQCNRIQLRNGHTGSGNYFMFDDCSADDTELTGSF